MVENHETNRSTDVDDEGAASDTDPVGAKVALGTDVGGYLIEGELGHGGMGVVYSARHPVIGKRAAIKILRTEVSSAPITVARFIQEARAVNEIGHPNIVDIFAYGTLPDGRAYHVMDLLVGESLRGRLKRGPLHPSEAASVIDEIASALMAAHDHGFIHRDLKPDNVFLVTHDGRWPEVKLLDFGLAKLMPAFGAAPFVTKAGVVLGTPRYMSPEQMRGVGVDHRTDVYALGVVMFEILAGAQLFPSVGNSFSARLRTVDQPPPSLAAIVPGLPREMVQLVEAMLAKSPDARPSLTAVRTVIKRLRTTQLPTRSVIGLAALPNPHRELQQALTISASHVGAAVVVPGDPAAQPTARNRPGSQPNPQNSLQPAAALEPLAPPSPPPPPVVPSQAFQPTPIASAGLALRTSQPLTTTLGVPPPPKPVPSPLAAQPTKSHRVWITISVILAIAVGIAVALILGNI